MAVTVVKGYSPPKNPESDISPSRAQLTKNNQQNEQVRLARDHVTQVPVSLQRAVTAEAAFSTVRSKRSGEPTERVPNYSEARELAEGVGKQIRENDDREAGDAHGSLDGLGTSGSLLVER